MDFISILSIFVLACFVGYYVVWSVTPAPHAADERHQRHFLGHRRRRADRCGGGRQPGLEMARPGRRRAGLGEHLRRLRGHPPMLAMYKKKERRDA